MQPTLRKQIIDAQKSDEHLGKVWSQTETERLVGYSIFSGGGQLGKNHPCVPPDKKILKDIMTEAHDTSYTFHSESTKMYQDLKGCYWWPRIATALKGLLVEMESSLYGFYLMFAQDQEELQRNLGSC